MTNPSIDPFIGHLALGRYRIVRWLAKGGIPHPLVLWLFILGTVVTRSAGCAVNDFADRRFDADAPTHSLDFLFHNSEAQASSFIFVSI